MKCRRPRARGLLVYEVFAECDFFVLQDDEFSPCAFGSQHACGRGASGAETPEEILPFIALHGTAPANALRAGGAAAALGTNQTYRERDIDFIMVAR